MIAVALTGFSSPTVAAIATKYGRTREQIFYRYVQKIGGIPLSGTTSPQHMAEDLEVRNIPLDEDEIATIGALLH